MGIFDWLLGKNSKESEVKDVGKEGENLITAAIAEMLLTMTKGADVYVNAKDEDGVTALMAAELEGHTETVEMLLTKGADVNAKSKVGWTALMVAALEGHTKIVRLLEQAGAKE